MTYNTIVRAYELLHAHRLHDWKLKWRPLEDDGLDQTLGETCFESKTIFLDDSVGRAMKQVLLHEVAHALVGPDHGHDQVWKDKALQIGCRPDCVSAFVGDDGDE